MDTASHSIEPRGFLAVLLAALLAGCGGSGGSGGGDGPAIQARPQTVAFAAAPTLPLAGTATVMATASSGLPVTYRSDTPFICSVNAGTGLVTALTPGDCIIAANQYGNNTYAPVRQTQTIRVSVDGYQTVGFDSAPTLTVYSMTTVSATASSGLPVTYRSITPAICSVDSGTGLVIASSLAGDCTIAADQAGSSTYPVYYAAQATQTIVVSVPPGVTAPAAPTGVTATMGSIANTVKVSIRAVDAGGSPFTGFTVSSSPAGIAGTGAAVPIVVTCPTPCNGYAFSVIATTAVGDSAPSAAADVITRYDVEEVFREPATQPNDSIFRGSFSFNATAGTVSALAGTITESMTGGCTTTVGCPGSYGSVPMTLVPLTYQLQTWHDASLGGTFVATFAKNNTDTFTGFDLGTMSLVTGWLPDFGVRAGGNYAGYPYPYAESIQNAYALIFVPDDPLAALSVAQINKLAYADCTPGGMMGNACMTGTSVAGYGKIGTMRGYPVSQTITRH